MPVQELISLQPYIDGLVQDCFNSNALAVELLQSYTKLLISTLVVIVQFNEIKKIAVCILHVVIFITDIYIYTCICMKKKSTCLLQMSWQQLESGHLLLP